MLTKTKVLQVSSAGKHITNIRNVKYFLLKAHFPNCTAVMSYFNVAVYEAENVQLDNSNICQTLYKIQKKKQTNVKIKTVSGKLQYKVHDEKIAYSQSLRLAALCIIHNVYQYSDGFDRHKADTHICTNKEKVK